MELSRSAAADRLFRTIRKESLIRIFLAAAIAVIIAAIVVAAAAVGIASAAEPKNEKNDDDPTAAAISKIKSTVHKKTLLI